MHTNPKQINSKNIFMKYMFLKNKNYDETQNSSSYNIKTNPKWV